MGQAPRNDLKDIGAVEREVDELRERTQSLLEELERRIRDGVDRARGTVARVKHAVDVPARLRELPAAVRRRPVLFGGIGVGGAAAIGFAVWLVVRRRRQAARPMARLKRRVEAYRTLIAEPRRERPMFFRRVLQAALIAAASTLARRIVTSTLESRPARRELAEPALGV